MKKYCAMIVIMAASLGICACDVNVNIEQDAENGWNVQIDQNGDAADKSGEGNYDEDGYEIEGNYDIGVWKSQYAEIVDEWEAEHEGDAELGFNLAWIDEDDAPELLLFCDDDAWQAMDMYTIVDGEAKKMKIADEDKDPDYEDSPYLSPGRQGMGDYCIEYTGIYLQSHGMMGSLHTTGYRKEGDEFIKIFEYDYKDLSFDEDIDEPISYTLTYTNSDGEDITVTQIVNDTDDYYEIDSIPEAGDLEKEFGFSFGDMKDLDKDRMDHSELEGEKKNTMAVRASGYTGLENLKNENNEDGTYYYEDMTEDGITVITNMCAPNSQRDGQDMDAYAENFVCALVDNDARITGSVEDTGLADKLSYPVYRISYESGSNEDTRQAVGVVILTDDYTYYYGFECPIDSFEDNEEFYDSELEDIELTSAED